jgi:hypothetical protein
VLSGKFKVWIFEQAVHEHDQFSHAGDQSHFWLFSGRSQAEVERFEDRVVFDCAQCGDVERAPDSGSAASAMAAAVN